MLCVKAEYVVNDALGQLMYGFNINFDNWNVVLDACANALTDVPWGPTTCLETGPDILLNPNGISDFFTNSDEANCPISSCEVKAGTDCLATVSDIVVGNSPSPFSITASGMSAYTYSRLCVICYVNSIPFTNNVGKVKVLDNLLSVKNPPADDIEIPYDATQTTQQTATEGFATFFEAASPGDCKPTSCTIYDPGCSESYTGDTSHLDAMTTEPFNILYF